MEKVPVKHHYVPQFVIKKFLPDDSSPAYVFDSRRCKTFIQSPSNILYETYLYSFNLSGLREYKSYIHRKGLSDQYYAAMMIYENKMKDIDGKTSQIYHFLNRDIISYEESALLILFVSINYFRSLKVYESHKHGSEFFVKNIQNGMKKQGFSGNHTEEYCKDKMTEDEIKLLFFNSIFSSKKELLNQFSEYYCLLLESDGQFTLGDTPFICLNLYRDDLNNNGLGKNGAFFIGAISKNFNILLLPRYLPSLLMDILDSIESSNSNPYDIMGKIQIKNTFAKKLLIDIARSITPESSNKMINLIHHRCNKEDIDVLNFLQIINSNRFIISGNDISKYLANIFLHNQDLNYRNCNCITEYYKTAETNEHYIYSKIISSNDQNDIIQRYHKKEINIYRTKNFHRSLLYRIQQASRLRINNNETIPGIVDYKSPIIYIMKK